METPGGVEDVARSEADALGDATGVSDATGATGAFGPSGTQTLVRTTPGRASADQTGGDQTAADGTAASLDPLAVLPERAFDNLLVVAARDHPNKLERRLEGIGCDPARVGVVPVVPAAREYDGDLWTTDPVSPDDLTGLGMRFSDAVRHVESGTGWVLVDALGVLLMYAEDSRVCRFFQTITNRVRAKDVQGVYCVNPRAVADETFERLRGLSDAERGVEDVQHGVEDAERGIE